MCILLKTGKFINFEKREKLKTVSHLEKLININHPIDYLNEINHKNGNFSANFVRTNKQIRILIFLFHIDNDCVLRFFYFIVVIVFFFLVYKVCLIVISTKKRSYVPDALISPTF